MKKKLQDEIAATLQEGGLDVFAEADLAADALDLADAEAAVRRPAINWRRHITMSAAILVASLVVWALLPTPTDDRDDAAEPEVAAGIVAKERAANQAFLESREVQAMIAREPKGTFIGIAGGGLFVSHAKLHSVNKELDAKHPKALHRFVFRAGTQGDVTYTTDADRILRIGGAFLKELGVTFAQRAEAMEFSREGYTLRIKGKKTMRVFAGSPEGMEKVPLAVNYSTASHEPLVLPPGIGFPRYEIPGSATVEAPGGKRQTGLRRYLAEVSIPGLQLRGAVVEAVSSYRSFVNDDGSLTLSGYRFEPLTDALRGRAKKEKRSLLVLERFPWLQRFPGNPFANLDGDKGLEEVLERLRYVLAWKRAEPADAWAGHSSQAPPTHSVLSVFGPYGKPCGRLVVTAASTSQQIGGLLAGVQHPPRSRAVKRAEVMAIATLRNWVAAQAHMQALGFIDEDRDGTGEFAGIRELSGKRSARLSMRVMKSPPVTTGDRSTWRAGSLEMYGYWYRIFLPGKGGRGVPEGADGFAKAAVDADLAEQAWCAYAWPNAYRDDGIRTFFVNQKGEVWATDGCYSGPDGGPAADAAFASPGSITGGVSPALPSVDGNRWKRVP